MDTAQVLLALATAVIGSLSTAVIHLFRQANKMASQLDGLQREIGKLEGFVLGLKSCPGGQTCPMKTGVDDLHTFQLKPEKPKQ